MKRIIYTEKAPKPIGPYSQAIQVDNLIYLSGQIGISPETGNLVEGGIVAETKQIFANLKSILESINCSLDDIVSITIYLTDLSKFAEMNNIYAQYFNKDYPARATVQVSALPKGACIEMSAVAFNGYAKR
ncbi:MAG: RidA family protein [candidate division WOR-3 bacterium]|nr:RidA family protein [candidate division WOR-3 bacterium]